MISPHTSKGDPFGSPFDVFSVKDLGDWRIGEKTGGSNEKATSSGRLFAFFF